MLPRGHFDHAAKGGHFAHAAKGGHFAHAAVLAQHALQLLHLRLQLLDVAPALAARAVGSQHERLEVELQLGPVTTM